MDAPQRQPRPSAWRFSLRELLLFMTTVAAVLALARVAYRRSEPFLPTKLSEKFCHPGQIELALQRAGVTRPALMQGGGGPSTDSESRSASGHYIVDISEQELLALIQELFHEAERQVQEEGGRIDGRGSSGGMGHAALALKYRADQTFGELHIAGDPISDKKSRLFIFIHEHRIRP